MEWNVYLSGEIHTKWREEIKQSCKKLNLPIEFTEPITNHDLSDNCGAEILGQDIDKFWNIYGSKGIHGQSLYDVETNPGGRGFDASLEEVLHLITEYGYAHTYPKELGDPSSLLAKAMDKARGGKFKKVSTRT